MKTSKLNLKIHQKTKAGIARSARSTQSKLNKRATGERERMTLDPRKIK